MSSTRSLRWPCPRVTRWVTKTAQKPFSDKRIEHRAGMNPHPRQLAVLTVSITPFAMRKPRLGEVRSWTEKPQLEPPPWSPARPAPLFPGEPPEALRTHQAHQARPQACSPALTPADNGTQHSLQASRNRLIPNPERGHRRIGAFPMRGPPERL